MGNPDGGTEALTPEDGWSTVHETLERTRSSMYVAGTSTILLLWGAIVAIGFTSQYAVQTLASDFAADRPWYPGPLWGVLVVAGMTGSAIIGTRASREIAVGTGKRSAGIRVFLFWLAIVAATLLIPAAAGTVDRRRGRNQDPLRRHRHRDARIRPFRHHGASGPGSGGAWLGDGLLRPLPTWWTIPPRQRSPRRPS